jgi:hypothetical protein
MGFDWLLPFVAGMVIAFGLTIPGIIFAKQRQRLQGRTIDEVAEFIFDPGEEKLLLCLDSTQDNLWRLENDRRVQRIRIERFHDCLTFMVGNVTVLYELGKSERESQRRYHFEYEAEMRNRIERLIEDSLRFLRIASVPSRKLKFFRLMRFEAVGWMSVPQIAEFQTISGIDFVEAYKAVARAAEELVRVHGEVAPIAQRIRLCFWLR